jgi:hypothetical protein
MVMILLMSMMNMHKILHSYKQWEDYNKQQDIGLMTLYHQQRTTYATPMTQIATNPLREQGEGGEIENGLFG